MLRIPALDDSRSQALRVVRPVRSADRRLTSAMDMLRAILGALPDGLAAQRRYEHLRSEGVPHNLALRQAFGISPPVRAGCA
jgi:hypothetical protein